MKISNEEKKKLFYKPEAYLILAGFHLYLDLWMFWLFWKNLH